MKHSPEPWSIKTVSELPCYNREYIAIFDANEVSMTSQASYDEWGPNDDDLARIVACVNACAGVKTEDLEAVAGNFGGAFTDKCESLAAVTAQRDLLLDALKTAREYVYLRTHEILRDSDMKEIADDYAEIQAVIAKCEVQNG